MGEPRGSYSRGYLPHYDAGSQAQFITWRLHDSVPARLIEGWRAELSIESEDRRKRELYRRVEEYLDAGHGSCILRNPAIAVLVQDAILALHGSLLLLHEWIVMPNHVHVLVTPLPGIELSTLVKRCKGSTAREANKFLGKGGRFWQPDYFDRLIRNEKHFEGTAHYIRRNAVKARLCSVESDWPYGSCNEKLRRELVFRGMNSADRGAE
jgi:REP element-mobilizing transposase RayT